MADEIKQIVLSDESVNVYGFRVLTSGIDLSQFKGNPVMLYNHRRSVNWSGTADDLPIGKWNEVVKSEARLVATPEFDDEDEYAVKISKKYVKGYLNAASIGFDIVELSEDPKRMLPGQTRPTITKCILTEASICDIPGNRNALKLTYQGHSIALSGTGMDKESLDAILPAINLSHNKSEKEMNKELITTTLGLPADAKDTDIIAKLTSMVNTQAKVDELQTKLASMEKAQNDAKVEALVGGAIKDGKLTEAQRDIWTGLAQKDFDGAKLALDGMQAYTPPNRVIEGNEQPGAANLSDAEKYVKLDKEGKLADLMTSNKPEFERLQAAYLSQLKTQGIIG